MIRKLIAVVGALLLVANVLAATDASSGVTFFQHTQYGGYAIKLGAGDYSLSQLASKRIRNDEVSSLKIPSGWKAVLYEHDNYSDAGGHFHSSSAPRFKSGCGNDADAIEPKP